MEFYCVHIPYLHHVALQMTVPYWDGGSWDHTHPKDFDFVRSLNHCSCIGLKVDTAPAFHEAAGEAL